IDVLRPGRILVRRLEVLPQRRRPWLVWDVAIGRIHDEARVALDHARYALIELLRAAQRGIERMRAPADRTPCALHVRLAIGRLAGRPRSGRRLPVLALTGQRDREQNEERHRRAVHPHERYANALNAQSSKRNAECSLP